MKIRDYLKKKLNVPDNWDKFDYEIQRYSFEDIEGVLLDVVSKNCNLQNVKASVIDELTRHKNIALDAKLNLQSERGSDYFRALGQMEGLMFAIEYLEKHLT